MSRKERIYQRLLAIFPAGLTYNEIASMEKVPYRRAYAEVQPLIWSRKVKAETLIDQQRVYAIPPAVQPGQEEAR